jgi:hypothetical protein
MPIAAQTPLRAPMPTPVPAARMQPSPVAASPVAAPTPAKPAYVAASIPAAVTPAASQSDSGNPITRTVRANVRDVNASHPVAPKPSEESTTIRTPRPDPISADHRSFETQLRNAVPAPQEPYKFAIQDEEERNDMTKNTPPWWKTRSVAAAVFVILAAGIGVAGRSLFSPSADAAVPGTLVVETNPPGVPVVLDGKRSGQTPVRLEVSAGSHVLTLLTEPAARTIPVTIAAGATVSQYVEVPKVVAETGQLQIRTDPSGARVVVDGTPRGAAPVTVENLMPGAHTVDVSNENGSVRQEITVSAGTTSSLVVPMQSAPQGSLSGFISVAAPVDLQIFEDVRLVGSSRSDRVMVSVGRHELDIVNEALGFRTRRTVNVTAGQVANIKLDWPNGSMALNAQPWAEVFIDGERVGETPIGNVPVPIGTHEVRFRHPELGEQVVRSTVTLGSPARLSVDLRKK